MHPRDSARPRPDELPPAPEHGAHTLRVWRGTVVDCFGDDVFIELGPRMQGVISKRHFEAPPRAGESFEFTLRGQEEGLWSLALSTARSLVTWEQMEIGCLVHARVVRVAPGGLEVKIGPLHGFLPKSHTGLPRDEKVDPLVGRVLTCEVIEVDPERQRVTVSRKLVVQRERESEHARVVDRLKIGEVVQGRVTRIEDYGVFVSFGHGMEGMVHVSNLSYQRVAHPSEVVKVGELLDLRVLHLKRGGKRIALGLKQVGHSPWREVETTLREGQIVECVVTRVLDFGAFVALRPGVEGLVHASETGFAREQSPRAHLKAGQRMSARILSFDIERERMSLSLLHESGVRIAPEEAENARAFDELVRDARAAHDSGHAPERLSLRLGDVLRRVLDDGPKLEHEAG